MSEGFYHFPRAVRGRVSKRQMESSVYVTTNKWPRSRSVATASLPRSRGAPGRCRPAGTPEASRIARRGLSCPWPARWLGRGSPSSGLPGAGFPVRRPDATPRQPELLGTRRGWMCPRAATRGCLLDGEPTRRSRAGRGQKRSEKRTARRGASGRLRALPGGWVDIFNWI